ncbi:pumilio homolog 12-like [Henckelia pumila]|uniref:pumilio homolog 12-like n=1 Tax=Henckelia pumila TaxID=405737 RepID=UPI003C6E2C60
MMDDTKFPTPGIYEFPMDSAGQKSFEDLKGKVLSIAKDPDGCQLLRQKLLEGRLEDTQIIFSELKDGICALMMDPFGGVVTGKLFEVCDEEQMNELVSSITSDVRLLMSLCLHSQGPQYLRIFLECLRTPEQISHVISVLTVPLARDEIGSRVISHCFDIFPAKESMPIHYAITNHFLEIAFNEIGSCLLQGLISGSVESLDPRTIISTTLFSGYRLSTQKFGSRVLLHVIGLEIQHMLFYLVDNVLKGAFADLSIDEYGSIVVKKLMGACRGKYAPRIINEIILSPKFLYILVDPCGYSVLEYAKDCCKVSSKDVEVYANMGK